MVDADGNLYGTTAGGGSAGYGAVFKLTPDSGAWTQHILFEFSQKSGTRPAAGLTLNPTDGSLYGTASAGNSLKTGGGTVFQLSPPTIVGEQWTQRTLYEFTFLADGGWPAGSITREPDGTLYGTASRGGLFGCDANCGVVYQIIP